MVLAFMAEAPPSLKFIILVLVIVFKNETPLGLL